MEIQVNTPHVKASEEDVRELVAKSLGRFSERLTRVEVFLKDVNAKRGGIDKQCVVEARPRGLDPLAVTHEAEDLVEAVTGAADRLGRMLSSRFGKLDKLR